MDRTFLVRASALYLPIAATVLLWIMHRPSKSARAGVLLACIWNLVTLLPMQMLATHNGWWQFGAQGGLFLGVPVDLYLGWILLWGALPLLAFPRLSLLFVAAIFLIVDLVFMPMMGPVLRLGPHWLGGDALIMLGCLLPSQMLGRWTRNSTHLSARALLQIIAFSGLILGIVPALVLENTGETWTHPWTRPDWVNGIILQLLIIPAGLGLSAVQEFVKRGRGTPLPYDPPQLLVTSGPYAFISNPMQVSAAVLLAGWGWFLGSFWVAAAGIMAHIYSLGLAAWDESQDVHARFGTPWLTYRNNVRNWIPRWRPWHPSQNGPACPARLYVSESCGPCSQVKRWFEQHGAVGLNVVAAERHPRRDLDRITYDPSDGGAKESGVAALGRGLEHINLAYAFMGWMIRLPVLVSLLQLLADASGAGPRTIPRRTEISDTGGT